GLACRQDEALVGGGGGPTGAGDGLGNPSGGDRQAEVGEQAADLALRDAHLLFQVHGQGDGVGADHRGGRPGSLRGLVGVTSPDRLAAAPAAALVDPQAQGAHRHRRDVLDPLLDGTVDLHLATAVAVGGAGHLPAVSGSYRRRAVLLWVMWILGPIGFYGFASIAPI